MVAQAAAILFRGMICQCALKYAVENKFFAKKNIFITFAAPKQQGCFGK